MIKIPCVFKRDYDHPEAVKPQNKGRFLAYNEVNPGCEWVLAGEGTPTRKWDGTAVMLKEGIWYKRYDAKHGKTPPSDFVPCQEPDEITGHWPGWVPVYDTDPSSKYIVEAIENTFGWPQYSLYAPDGTYEAVGPKIGSSKDGLTQHVLLRHGRMLVGLDSGQSYSESRTFDAIREYLQSQNIEGIVFHHPDGRMAKIRRGDFGFKW